MHEYLPDKLIEAGMDISSNESGDQEQDDEEDINGKRGNHSVSGWNQTS